VAVVVFELFKSEVLVSGHCPLLVRGNVLFHFTLVRETSFWLGLRLSNGRLSGHRRRRERRLGVVHAHRPDGLEHGCSLVSEHLDLAPHGLHHRVPLLAILLRLHLFTPEASLQLLVLDPKTADFVLRGFVGPDGFEAQSLLGVSLLRVSVSRRLSLLVETPKLVHDPRRARERFALRDDRRRLSLRFRATVFV
jgi:hypothetical protein